jgi:Uma2 family endonuclease
MNLQSKYPTTADEFLRWNEGREGKREFVRGKVVEMMINVTRNHAEIAANLLHVLRRQLDRKSYSVGSADFGVRTADGIRYPDVFVDRKSERSRGLDLAATDPLLVAEVLSPSSFGRDFVEKMSDYRSIDSLSYYLILSHEEPRAWLSRRSGEEWRAPEEIFGGEAAITLDLLRVEFSLGEIYDGVEVRPGQ